MNIRQIIEEELYKKIDDDFRIISESLNNPIPVTLHKTSFGYSGEFVIEGNKYLITVEETVKNGSCFIFKFTMNDSFEMVGDVRKAFSVIPTIKKVVNDFIIEHKPTLFIFNKSDSSRGRERIYNEFSNEISKKYGYKRSIKTIGDNVLYMLTNNLNGDDYTESLSYIIKKYGEFDNS
tara:strand:+ start:3703 stop:4236 length:534 start_codon:yes stop_codon:yes gene_type:complete